MSPSRPAPLARRLAVLATGLGLALGAVLGVAQSASAHDELGGSDPADGAAVTTLSAVTLLFEEAPLATGDATAQLISVTGPDGRHYETACAAVEGTDVTVPVALGAAGAYQVIWRVVSDDGHPVSGQFSFTYTGTADAAAGADSSPCGAVAASGAGDQGAGWVAGVSALAVLAGIILALAMLYLQARKTSPRPDADADGTGTDGTGVDGTGTDPE